MLDRTSARVGSYLIDVITERIFELERSPARAVLVLDEGAEVLRGGRARRQLALLVGHGEFLRRRRTHLKGEERLN